MRIQTVIIGCALVVLSLVHYSDAVACSDTVTTNCTDCDLAENAEDADCVTTTEEATTVATDSTTVSSSATTTQSSAGGPFRRLIRRIRILQRRLAQCQKQAANQRASLIKQIKKLKASSSTTNSFKDKFFG